MTQRSRQVAGRTVPGHEPACVGLPVVLVLAFIGLLAFVGCASPPAEPPPSPESPAPVEPPNSRMVEILANVARRTPEENPYLGERMLNVLRKDLAALPPDADIPRRWLIYIEMAKYELRLGQQDEALAHYVKAFELLGESPDPVPRRYYERTMFEVGVAYLRWAETQNCVSRHTSDSCIFPIREAGVHMHKEGATEAIRFFMSLLESAPERSWESIRTRWLLNIAHMTLGTYPDGVPEIWRLPPSAFASDEPFPRFLDIAPSLGINSFDLAGGAAVEDFDGDGWLDIATSTWDTSKQLRYWRSNGDGTFTERTAEAGLLGQLGGLNIIHADYDNDGDSDLLVVRGAWWRDWGGHPNSLLRNDGGVFTDVTFESGLGEHFFPTQTADWGDYDNDGDLDLYIGNETDLQSLSTIDYATTGDTKFTVEAPSQLFRNNGDGTFTDVAAAAGVENLRYTKAVVWGDYDNDGFQDLYVANNGGRNRLYHNQGDGTFTDVAAEAGLERPIANIPAWFWDVNNDGALDIFCSGYGGPRLPADVGSVAASYFGLPPQGELPALFLGDGNGGFREVGREWGLDHITLAMGSNFGDLDNDGYQDFYLGTGYPYFEGLMPNQMYRNRNGESFANVTTAGGFGHLQKGHAVVFADLDNDGDQDVLQQVGGGYPGDAYGNALYENPGFGAHWLKLRLIGTRSNRDAVGARIRVDITENGVQRSIHRRVGTGGSFGSNPIRREIGLGQAEKIDVLEIYWPVSDTTQRLADLTVDRMIEVTEGQDGFRDVPLETFTFRR